MKLSIRFFFLAGLLLILSTSVQAQYNFSITNGTSLSFSGTVGWGDDACSSMGGVPFTVGPNTTALVSIPAGYVAMGVEVVETCMQVTPVSEANNTCFTAPTTSLPKTCGGVTYTVNWVNHTWANIL